MYYLENKGNDCGPISAVIKSVINPIAEPFEKHHRISCAKELYKDYLSYQHEERMAIYRAMENAEANGTMTPEARCFYYNLLHQSSSVNVPTHMLIEQF